MVRIGQSRAPQPSSPTRAQNVDKPPAQAVQNPILAPVMGLLGHVRQTFQSRDSRHHAVSSQLSIRSKNGKARQIQEQCLGRRDAIERRVIKTYHATQSTPENQPAFNTWIAQGAALMVQLEDLAQASPPKASQLDVLKLQQQSWVRRAPQASEASSIQNHPPLDIDREALLHDVQQDLEALSDRWKAQYPDAIGDLASFLPEGRIEDAIYQTPTGKMASFEDLQAWAQEAAHHGALALDEPEACAARGHVLTETLSQQGLAAFKVLVKPSMSSLIYSDCLSPAGHRPGEVEDRDIVTWGYHTAAAAIAIDPQTNRPQVFVCDPAFSDQPMRLSEWTENFVHANNGVLSFSLRAPDRLNVEGPRTDNPAWNLLKAHQVLARTRQNTRADNPVRVAFQEEHAQSKRRPNPTYTASKEAGPAWTQETSLQSARHEFLYPQEENAPRYQSFKRGGQMEVFKELTSQGRETGRVARMGHVGTHELAALESARKLGLTINTDHTASQTWGRKGIMVQDKAPGIDIFDLAVSSKTSNTLRRTISKRIIESFAKLHRSGWLHGAPHANNVLYDKSSDTLSLIDFERARPQKKDHPNAYRNELLQLYAENVLWLKPTDVTESEWFDEFAQSYLDHVVGERPIERERTQTARTELQGFRERPDRRIDAYLQHRGPKGLLKSETVAQLKRIPEIIMAEQQQNRIDALFDNPPHPTHPALPHLSSGHLTLRKLEFELGQHLEQGHQRKVLKTIDHMQTELQRIHRLYQQAQKPPES